MASTKQGSLGFTQTEAAITEHESLLYVLSIYALFVEGFVCVCGGGGSPENGRAVSDSVAWSVVPFSHTGWPCPGLT